GLQQAMELYKVKQFPASDAIMSRCICTPINLGWSDAEVAERAEKLVNAVKSAL
ncbi:MAG: DegT/DnrJ/EryC1/StrS aminotransferase, partial [Bacteroidetes bacterium]|nr:DegT/DnrJ/EryC1/StrS aminotransferase [Bacteroidota bacterium]